MNKGICLLSVIPVRENPDDKSELVTQLIWGEMFNILKNDNNKWLYIKTFFDNYEGWISKNQISLLDEEQFNELASKKPIRVSSLIGVVKDLKSGCSYLIPAGSDIYNINDRIFSLAGKSFKYDGELNCNDKKTHVDYALLFINTPYLWGGRSPMGIDCSALVQLAFKLAGVNVKRDAYLQAEEGEKINDFDNIQPGDLLFFDENNKIKHVGISLNSKSIIHAHGMVKIDKYDKKGIFDEEKKEYSHKLCMIRRIKTKV